MWLLLLTRHPDPLQTVIERLVRQLTTSEGRCEMAASRLTDLAQRNKQLQDDLVHMRQILHEEKQSQQVRPGRSMPVPTCGSPSCAECCFA